MFKQDNLYSQKSLESPPRLVLRIAANDSKSSSKLSLKFGARLEQVGKLLKLAAKLCLEVIGVSFHVGCKCSEGSVFKQAIADARHVFDKAVSWASDLNVKLGHFQTNDLLMAG